MKAVFLDRDGVIIATNVVNGKPYAIRDVAELAILPGASEIINKFKSAGYKIVVVTNQPDIGNGLVAAETVNAMHGLLLAKLPIDVIKTCPHSQTANCNCRKPKIGMFTDAANELNIDLTKSIMIGDRSSDIQAGKQARCFTIFIDYGYNEPLKIDPDLKVSSLTELLNVATLVTE